MKRVKAIIVKMGTKSGASMAVLLNRTPFAAMQVSSSKTQTLRMVRSKKKVTGLKSQRYPKKPSC